MAAPQQLTLDDALRAQRYRNADRAWMAARDKYEGRTGLTDAYEGLSDFAIDRVLDRALDVSPIVPDDEFGTIDGKPMLILGGECE